MTFKQSPPLAILERVVRNLPVVKPEFYRTETPDGTLYFAIGREVDLDRYHGVWGFVRGPGIAQPVMFAPNQPKKRCIKHLVELGSELMSMMNARGMFDEGYWRGGR